MELHFSKNQHLNNQKTTDLCVACRYIYIPIEITHVEHWKHAKTCAEVCALCVVALAKL